jgi:hypothetical protein
LIKPKGLLVDATVFENNITFPTDCRLAQKAYLGFSKKRKKTVNVWSQRIEKPKIFKELTLPEGRKMSLS